MKALIISNLCYGVFKTHAISFCDNAYEILHNISELSQRFEICHIINDIHKDNDIKFNYLPQYNIANSNNTLILKYFKDNIKSRHIHIHHKNSIGLISKSHILELIKNSKYDQICVTGYLATISIVPMVLDLIEQHNNVAIKSDCIADINQDYRDMALKYMKIFGIKELQDD